jgi:hypothetical protein
MKHTPQEQCTHVELWQESGLSKAAYCREANIRYHLFNAWVHKHQQASTNVGQSSGEAFVRLVGNSTATTEGIAAEFDPSQKRWYIHASANPEWVGRLFRVLHQC